MRLALIGAVKSSRRALIKLVEHNLNPLAVFGYEPSNSANVSGYVSLKDICLDNNILYYPFRKINDHSGQLEQLSLDFLFVVGLSQLVSEEIISRVRVGCIGFHPTLLPEGRGRAPIAWLILDNKRQGASTFFVLDKDADAGPILTQEKFAIQDDDDASEVEKKILDALDRALDRLLPALKEGVWNPRRQDELCATEYGRRTQEDGLIDWAEDARDIDRLVKAAAPPHPGAFTFFKDERLVVLKSEIAREERIKGVMGKILRQSDGRYLVQCGSGMLWLNEIDGPTASEIRVGSRLGYLAQLEIFELRKEIKRLKERYGG